MLLIEFVLCCELHMDIRPLPGLTLQDLDDLLHETLAPVKARWPGRLSVEALHEPIPGYECPTDHKMVAVIENYWVRKRKLLITVPKHLLFKRYALR